MGSTRQSRRRIVHLIHERIGDVGGIQRFDLRTLLALHQIAADEDCDLEVLALNGIAPGVILPAGLLFRSANANRWRLLRLLFASHWNACVDQVFIGHLQLVRIVWPVRLFFFRSRYLLFVHGIEAWSAGRSSRRRAVSRAILLRCVDTIISVSRFTAEKMSAAYEFKLDRIRLLPNAIDVPASIETAATRSSSSRVDAPVLLTVTRMDRHDAPKGVHWALAAIAELCGEFPLLKYRVVGDGELRATYETMAGTLGIADRVEFLGRMADEQLNEVYRSADIFLLPSSKEGFGIVFLEAWKFGLPVVCGNLDASAEVVENESDGLTVCPHDPPAIADALRRLIQDPQLRLQLAANGRRKLLLKYSNTTFVTNLRHIVATTGPAGSIYPQRADAD